MKDLDRIEKFLSGKMTPDENEQFEKELRESKDLADQTKKVAYIIHSINVVGLKRDNERIKRIHASVSVDYKRFVVSIAAMLTVVLVFATVVSVPVYQHVVKPVIEKVLHSEPVIKKKSGVIPLDTISLPIVDTLDVDTIMNPVAQPIENEVFPVDVDDTLKPIIVKDTLKVEKEISNSLLKNYEIGNVLVRREKNNVICSFTMRNFKENAKIQMHSARAKAGNGKSFLAKNCLLNGRKKRIIEKWKKDEEHLIEITIVSVPNDVFDLESISFSFQSEGDSLRQKSQSIILKVGEIK